MEDVTKRCPYCGEEILAIAIKCRYCHEWLDNNNVIKELDSKENTLATNDKRAIEASPEETLINEEEAITDEGTNLSEENNDEDKSGLEEDKSLIYNDEDKINQINKIGHLLFHKVIQHNLSPIRDRGNYLYHLQSTIRIHRQIHILIHGCHVRTASFQCLIDASGHSGITIGLKMACQSLRIVNDFTHIVMQSSFYDS
jgi:hypothetical protein